jgi:hypothetical protein
MIAQEAKGGEERRVEAEVDLGKVVVGASGEGGTVGGWEGIPRIDL